MSQIHNLLGKEFGYLTVISLTDQRQNRAAMWLCRCKCGQEVTVKSQSLVSGNTLSCGCYNREKSAANLLDQQFGRLKVVEKLSERAANGGLLWKCICSCGNETIVPTSNIVSGRTTSCGCYFKEVATKHGLAGTPEYKVWTGMISRCFDQLHISYHNYGGRGITVCKRWLESFPDFYADMGKRPSPEHTLDREDNDRNYEPNNCRWATREEQLNNRRNNVYYEYNGERKTVSQWARNVGMSVQTLFRRLGRGMNINDALTIPVKIYNLRKK